MSVVGSDDQTVLTGKIENMRDVVVRLAGDKNVAFMEEVFRKLPPGRPIANLYLPVDPRYPLRESFDKAPAQLGKELRHLAHKIRETCGNGRHPEHGNGASRRRAIKIAVISIAIGDMDRDGHV